MRGLQFFHILFVVSRSHLFSHTELVGLNGLDQLRSLTEFLDSQLLSCLLLGHFLDLILKFGGLFVVRGMQDGGWLMADGINLLPVVKVLLEAGNGFGSVYLGCFDFFLHALQALHAGLEVVLQLINL